MKDKAAKENSKNLKPNKRKILEIIRDNQNITKVKPTEITNLGKKYNRQSNTRVKRKRLYKKSGFQQKDIGRF